MVAPGIGDEKEPWLPEGSLDLISEGARGEAAGDGGAANVSVTKTSIKTFDLTLPLIHSTITGSVNVLASSVDQTAFPKSGSSSTVFVEKLLNFTWRT